MPLVYRCGNCGYVLHYLERVGQDFLGVPSVIEVLSRYGYTCPKCRSRLRKPTQESVVITSASNAAARGMTPVRIGQDYYVPPRPLVPQALRPAPAEAPSP